jgi:hypothetical protein
MTDPDPQHCKEQYDWCPVCIGSNLPELLLTVLYKLSKVGAI